MKRALSLILVLVMLVGFVPRFALPVKAAQTTVENLRYDDHLDMTGKTVEIIDAGTPTSYQVGYGVTENEILDTAVVTMEGETLVATGIGTAKVKIDGELHEITVTAAPISLLLLIGHVIAYLLPGGAYVSFVRALDLAGNYLAGMLMLSLLFSVLSLIPARLIWLIRRPFAK